jgi:DNA polymerase/3'-5' exonuclease PolX
MEWDRTLAPAPSASHKRRNAISALAYRRASMTLRCLTYTITAADQIAGLPFINDTITEMVDYVLRKGSLIGYPNLRNADAQPVLSEFITVWGVGPATAWEWYTEGYRSLDEVELAVTNRQLTVSEQVAVYFEHRAELSEAVTRRDIVGLQQWVTALAKELDEVAQVTAVGGYRRGKHTAHDVDFLITATSVPSAAMLSHLLERVQAHGRMVYISQFDVTFRTADAVAAKRKARASTGSIPPSVNFDDLSKKLCIVSHPQTGKARRVDFVVCTPAQHAFALLGWTGNKMYNRELRRWADNHGFHLSSSGLWKLDTADDAGKSGCADNPIVSVAACTEEEVLQALGLPYLAPGERHH